MPERKIWPVTDDLVAWDLWSWLRVTADREKSPSDIRDRLTTMTTEGNFNRHWRLYRDVPEFAEVFLPPDTPAGDLPQ